MRGMICVLALLAAAPAAAGEGVVACTEFRTAWAGALAKLDLARTAPTYGAADTSGAEPVQGLAEIEARLTCRDGILGRLNLRAESNPDRFARAASTVLLALDRDMTAEAATATIAALKTETRGGTRTAVSSWGPYELTWGNGDELSLDLNEN